jgi:hypothetical protein
MRHVRDQDITVEGEFTSDGMRLELSIDLDDLLRDGGVLRICKWDADGTFIIYWLKGRVAAHQMSG